MSLKFSTTSAPVEDSGVKALVYSPGGFGKTVLIGTLPGNPVILSAESGMLSLQPANQIRMWGAARDIPVIHIEKPADLQEAYTFLTTNKTGLAFDNIGVDSASEIAEKLLAAYLSSFNDGRKAYGEMAQTMNRYIRLFRDLPGRNVIFTAKQDRTIDAENKLSFGPSMPGKQMEMNIGYFFDEVFALHLLDGKDKNGHNYRALRTRPNPQYQAKDRSGALA